MPGFQKAELRVHLIPQLMFLATRPFDFLTPRFTAPLLGTVRPVSYWVCDLRQICLMEIESGSESEVAQSCLTLWDTMDCSLPGSSVHEIFQAKYWSGVPLPSSPMEIMIFIIINLPYGAVCAVFNFKMS